MSRLLVGSALLALAACGSTSAPPPTQAASSQVATTDAARQAATERPQLVPRVLPATAEQRRLKAVPFERLSEMLPSVDGWTRSENRSEQLFTPAVTTRAEALYRQANSHVELAIEDSAGNELILAPISVFFTNGYYERVGDGFRRASRVSGSPSFEEWHPAGHRGEVTALVGDRIVVRASGHEVGSLDPVKQVIGAVRFAELARLR